MDSPCHPSDDLLAAAAAGRMPVAPRITVSAHMERCHRCRTRIRHIARPTTPDQIFGRLDLNRAADAGLDDAPRYLDDVRLPKAVGRAGLRPRRWVGRGFWSARVAAPQEDNWRAFLLRAPAGAVIPSHGHQGRELIAVLKGAFREDRTYSTGDFVESPQGQDHRQHVSRQGHCVCLISLQGSLQWRGFAKVLGPVLGM